ncbi:50S ribosomal protein L29 [Candidatus Nomurabacteria bacterium RIFCSPHIGHO2_01_FULL_38_19]|uniref:Large ribosomal subunit protein uL29 n=1 Tax=Candidatus Nomurabacteria bacterium RIFCSPHIGHO2_01_FULL_38_19 TaxID=1801732 RepID=A0A1F6UQJ8_9BACT|nr:MAG: 50S ribosomal protein L29 [Candidatus Nomurabacteria bacterium RIFCSPHIGHO2_01_FULL_38_19]
MKNKRDNLKGMSIGELEKKLTTLEESLRVIRFKAEGAKSKNVKEASSLKKQIAKIMTKLNNNKK